MSKIFDALRRSERERTGGEPTALPQGPEMLREAERRVASDWEASVSVRDLAALVEERPFSPELLSIPLTGPPVPLTSKASNSDEKIGLLSKFAPMPISITAESRLICLQDWKSPTAEALRLLAIRLRDIRRSKTLKKVVITSSVPREGKSTIASNLACALARRVDEKVLLIEGDVRRPVVLKLFGIEQRPGLCELMHGANQLADCVVHLPDAGLWVMPAGRHASNPLELLQSAKLPLVMDELAKTFDWIIIDSPPVLPLADTSIWMRLADGVLLITRLGVTEKKQLEKGLEALEPQKLLGALLNGAQVSRYSSYYYSTSEHS